jgi:hypothetical protein
MTKSLVTGQPFADSFLKLLESQNKKEVTTTVNNQPNTGGLIKSGISFEIQMKLPDVFDPKLPLNKYRQLFRGDTSQYGGDHSAADLAFCGYMARHGLMMSEADQVFRGSGLYRQKWDDKHGPNKYGQMTLQKAFSNISNSNQSQSSSNNLINGFKLAKADSYKPNFVPNGMGPRRFVGPNICSGIRLFPANALSTLVALGAVGKTSLLFSIACHVAAGKDWNNSSLKQQKVAMLFCEEDQQEINRKFSAIVSSWSSDEQAIAQENLLLIPFLGTDARLTTIDRNQYKGSGVTEEIIRLLGEFELKDGLVVFDHMQGFASGDLNISETATALCREANKIVDSTGSAVVFAAHISKANIKAEELTQGFAVGSLAFENATRQMSGLIPMTSENAKKFGLEENKRDYVRLSLAKNSYGSVSDGVWLKKCYSPEYHTIVMQPIELSPFIPAEKLNEFQKISKRIMDHIAKNPLTTKNMLDRLSGNDGVFKASKAKVRVCLTTLVESGEVNVTKVTDLMRQEQNIPKQVKEILQVGETKAANKLANIKDFEN